MGISISRIEKEFILGNMDEKKFAVRVHGNRREKEGVILTINDEESLEIYSEDKDWDGFIKNDEVRVFFSYYGHVMTFNTTVKDIGETLVLVYPQGIHKNLQRKYERVPPPEDSSVSFMVKETRVEMKFPKTEEFDPVEEPEIHGNLDTGNLNQLMESFRDETESFSDVSRIVMFRGKEPESLEERIIAHTGKILHVESLRTGLPRGGHGEDSRIITESYLFPKKKEDAVLKELSVEDLRDFF